MLEKLILYIEDNFHNRRLVQKVLSAQGYTVLLAEDGTEGLQMVQERRPQVLLLDISLPGIDGLQVAAQVKANPLLKGIYIIALTASAMVGDRERFLLAGCDDYLSKPLQVTQLIEKVNRYFSSHS